MAISKYYDGYRIRVHSGYDENGKRISVTKTLRNSTKRDALKVERKIKSEMDLGLHRNRPKTFKDFIDQWSIEKRATVSVMTWVIYKRLLDTYILKSLGKKPLNKIISSDISKVLNPFLKRGKIGQAEHIYVLLRTIFNAAIKKDEILKNPVLAIEKPKPPKREDSTLDPEQWQMIREYLIKKESNFLVPFTLKITTGMRRAEISGLKWKDIDFDMGLIKVRRNFHVVKKNLFYSDLKTERSRRSISIDPNTVQMLKDHFDYMKQYFSEFGEKLNPESPVFTIDLINPLRPDSLTQGWIRLRNRLGLPNVRLHDLRHTSASLMLYAGIPVGDVSDRLGHSQEGFTLNQYRHAVKGSQERSAMILAKILEPNANRTLKYESKKS